MEWYIMTSKEYFQDRKITADFYAKLYIPKGEYLWSMRKSREPVFNLPHRLQLESSFLSLIVSLSVERKMHGFTSFPFNPVNTVEPVVDLRGQRDHHAPPRIKIGHKNCPIQFLHPLIRIFQIFSLIFKNLFHFATKAILNNKIYSGPVCTTIVQL